MRIISVTPNIYQLTRWLFFNSYLVREDDGLTLVDANMGRCGVQLVKAAKMLGQPIRRIALTHAHSDHVGALDQLHDMLPKAKIFMSAREARILAGDRNIDPEEGKARLRGNFKKFTTHPTNYLNDLDPIGSLVAYASPGHTPGHFAFFDYRDRALLAGDVYSSFAGLYVTSLANPLFPFPAMATWDRAANLVSARKLVGLEPSYLLVGHGRALGEPVAAMLEALKNAEQTPGKQEQEKK